MGGGGGVGDGGGGGGCGDGGGGDFGGGDFGGGVAKSLLRVIPLSSDWAVAPRPSTLAKAAKIKIVARTASTT